MAQDPILIVKAPILSFRHPSFPVYKAGFLAVAPFAPRSHELRIQVLRNKQSHCCRVWGFNFGLRGSGLGFTGLGFKGSHSP